MIIEKKYDTFYNYLIDNEYFFEKETIENYLLSLKVKPFVILTGNSGTGKTKLSQLFSQYLMEKNPFNREENLVFEEDCEGYITFKDKYSSLSNDFFALGDTTLLALLGTYYHNYIMDFNVEGIGITLPIYLQLFAKSNDEELLKHLKSIDNLSDIEIKICKQDLIDTFISQKIIEKKCISFERALKEIPYYHFPDSELGNVLNIKKEFSWNGIVDGIETTFEFGIRNIGFTLNPSEYEELKRVFDEKDERDNIKIEADLSSLRKCNQNYKIVPVGANWTENRHIVGFHNVITNEYQSTPAYDLIKAANESKEPHFLILDEMNLSHVERYFADFLSAIESGEKIPLYGEEELTLPENLFIIGTVNVDETTYMFSPKVLDRANVIEFKTYPAFDYMNNKFNINPLSGNIKYLENPLDEDDIREKGIDELRNLFAQVTVNGESFWKILSKEINEFQDILKDSGFDFGFRVINEIVRFMAVAWKYEDEPSEFTNWTRYFDACIKQKMLPKLHGSEKIIGKTLKILYKNCLSSSIDNEEIAKYPESYKKLKEMQKVLREQRYVSFIN